MNQLCDNCTNQVKAKEKIVSKVAKLPIEVLTHFHIVVSERWDLVNANQISALCKNHTGRFTSVISEDPNIIVHLFQRQKSFPDTKEAGFRTWLEKCVAHIENCTG